MTMLKFTKIPRIDRFKNLIENTNEEITVTEKLDGSNASFRLHNGEIHCFSRNLPLSEENTLNGFYTWVQKNISPETLNPNYTYYGEWMTKHKIDYKQHFGQFILFAVRENDTVELDYLPFEKVQEEAEKINVKLVHLHYKGKFKDWKHIEQFVSKSGLEDVEFAEGCVIFVPELVFPRDKESQVFLKLISENFAEVKKTLPTNNKQSKFSLDARLDTFITQNRMDKVLMKLQDEGVLKKELDIEDMGYTLKTLGNAFVEDILEEELETLVTMMRKNISKRQPVLVKNYITEQSKSN